MRTKKFTLKIFGVILISLLISSCGTSKNAAITCPVYPYYKGNKTLLIHTSNRRGYPTQGRIVGKKQHTGMSRKIQNRKTKHR